MRVTEVFHKALLDLLGMLAIIQTLRARFYAYTITVPTFLQQEDITQLQCREENFGNILHLRSSICPLGQGLRYSVRIWALCLNLALTDRNTGCPSTCIIASDLN